MRFLGKKKKTTTFFGSKVLTENKRFFILLEFAQKRTERFNFLFPSAGKKFETKVMVFKKKRMQKVLGLSNISKSQVLFSKGFLKDLNYHKRFWIAEFSWRFDISQI